MKFSNLILAGGILCIICIISVPLAAANTSKTFNLSVTNWVTPNPPTREELAGHVCVVEFWATWCPPCREQIPHMKSLVKKYADRNVIFVGLSEDKSASIVQAFVEKKGMNYNIGMDNGMSERLGVNGIPTAFVISHKGKILWVGHPGDDGFEDAIESAVKAAPKAMLSGVEMGRFSHLRLKLCGGRNFANAYTVMEERAKSCNCSEKSCACKIFEIVNAKLQEKITAAQQMQDKDPQTALAMYKEIMDSFGGISLTKQIEPAYLKLQQQMATQMPAAAGQQAKAN